MTAKYGKIEYWEERYKKDAEPFEWFQKYSSLKPIFEENGLNSEHKILVLGCGTSQVSEELYDDGYKNITNIDFSPLCINIMENRCSGKPEMTFRVMNVLDMKDLEGEVFDFIIDKGTFDCVMCGDNSFDNIQIMLKEVQKHLAPRGLYMLISYGAPTFRLNHLQHADLLWTVSMSTIQRQPTSIQSSVPNDEETNVHYVYICKKDTETNTSAPPAAVQNEEKRDQEEA